MGISLDQAVGGWSNTNRGENHINLFENSKN